MRIVTPEFYQDFRCLAGSCPDSCCRQGWQIAVDGEHLRQYRMLPGELGDRVRAALRKDGGDTVLAMDSGVCRLLDDDGLCALARAHGEAALCHLCHTHPRFLEQYGGTREVHLSLQCPEAARLTLCREEKLRFAVSFTEEEVTQPCTIDPDEYMALLEIRTCAMELVQERTLPLGDRMVLLLALGKWVQPRLAAREYELCKPICNLFRRPAFRRRQRRRTVRLRLRGTSFLPEVRLLRSLEHLTEEFPALCHLAVFTRRDSRELDRCCAIELEQYAAALLSHYIPKAVCDGNVLTKLRFAVLMTLTLRRFAVVSGEWTPSLLCRLAGLLAKEVEHSPENMALLYEELENPCWHDRLTAPWDTERRDHAI